MDLELAGVGAFVRDRAIGTLALAFVADPFLRWIYPEPGQYLKHFPKASLAFGGVTFSKAECGSSTASLGSLFRRRQESSGWRSDAECVRGDRRR